jgi:electron transfer flavoprotein beta subunit
MKILVTIKPVPDPEQPVSITDKKVDISRVGIIPNPFDEYALETSLRLTEKIENKKPVRNGEIVVLIIGEKNSSLKIMKTALAIGADRGIFVEANDFQLDINIVSQIIEYFYEMEKPDLIIMGKQSVDGENSQVPQYVAGALNLPQATFACKIVDKGKFLYVFRELDQGVEQKLVYKPAVISVDLRIVHPENVISQIEKNGYKYTDGPRYPSIKGFLSAKKKPLKTYNLGDLDITTELCLIDGLATYPPQRTAGKKVSTVEELLNIIEPK